MGYYKINFFLEAYALQEYTLCDGKIGKAGEIIVKAQYLSCIQKRQSGITIKNSTNKP